MDIDSNNMDEVAVKSVTVFIGLCLFLIIYPNILYCLFMYGLDWCYDSWIRTNWYVTIPSFVLSNIIIYFSFVFYIKRGMPKPAPPLKRKKEK